MKKILTLLAVINLTAAPLGYTVACGTVNEILDNPNIETQNQYIKLFDKSFASKQEAIAYFLTNESGVNIKTDKKFKNNLQYGENTYTDIEDIYNEIKNNFKINKTYTNKDVKNHLMNDLGQLDSNVKQDSNDEIIVYKDKNGQAISEIDNPDLALKEAMSSYDNEIQKEYVFDGIEYTNQNDIQNAIYQKFLNGGKVDTADLYPIGNNVYSENDAKKIINNNIKTEVTYNNKTFDINKINNLNNIKPSTEDSENIVKQNVQYGQYYIEMLENSKGTYTGDSVLESTEDLSTYILNANNWTLESSTTTSLKEFLLAKMATLVMNFLQPLLSINKNSNMEKVQNSFVEKVTIDSIFKSLSSNSEIAKQNIKVFKQLLDSYNLKGTSSANISTLQGIHSLGNRETAGIYFYQMREEFRNSQISIEDNKKIEKIYKEVLLNWEDSNEWKEIVATFDKEGKISDLMDVMTNPATFIQKAKKFSFFPIIFKALESIVEKAVKKISSNINKLLNDTRELILEFEELRPYLSQIEKTLKIASRSMLVLTICIELMDKIPVTKTETYVLSIPGQSNLSIRYQITNFIINSWTFDPGSLFRVVELKKPKNKETYLYEGRYFDTWDQAYIQLKKNLIDIILKDGKKAYTSTINDSRTFEDKQQLIDWIWSKISESKKLNLYTDFFGGEFTNESEAYESMKKHVDNQEFNITYHYNLSNIPTNNLYFSSYDDAKKSLYNSLNIETKVVSFSDIVSGHLDFESMDDLKDQKTEIYNFVYHDIDYYFDSLTNAVYYIMYLGKYQNNLVTEIIQEYELNNIHFENIAGYIEYLYENMKTFEIKGGE